MPGRLQFDFTFSQPQSGHSAGPRNNAAMRILLMGDFSGRNNRDLHETGNKLASRHILPVDIDNFDATMASIAPLLQLSIGESAKSDVTIDFAQLNDFHPDNLYTNLELFQELSALRARLNDASSFAQAAAELRHNAQQPQASAQSPELIASGNELELNENNDEDDAATFERLLGKQPAQVVNTSAVAQQNNSQAVIHQLIKSIVEPYSVPAAEPFQPQYVAMVDEAISEQMRGVLHHPEFQALEALWRSVHSLVSGLETGQELKLYLLDISKHELNEDIKETQGQLEQSRLYKLLVEKGTGTLGGEAWSILVGDYSFTTEIEDISLLASLGAISSQAGGPFLAAGHASLFGCKSLVETPDPRDWNHKDNQTTQAWQALRQSSVATSIGLAYPRVLLRLPYGEKIDTLDSFAFEELSSEPKHESFLWGNPAFTCALLIATAYQTAGWSMSPGDALDVEDLPAYTFKEDGASKLMPCAEVFLTEHGAETMLDSGLMPLISYCNRNAIRLMRFQSIAEPHKALAGAWA